MDKRTLIDDIAKELGASAEARKKWRQAGRGVPPAWQIKIVARAAELGEDVAFGDFEQEWQAS